MAWYNVGTYFFFGEVSTHVPFSPTDVLARGPYDRGTFGIGTFWHRDITTQGRFGMGTLWHGAVLAETTMVGAVN